MSIALKKCVWHLKIVHVFQTNVRRTSKMFIQCKKMSRKSKIMLCAIQNNVIICIYEMFKKCIWKKISVKKVILQLVALFWNVSFVCGMFSWCIVWNSWILDCGTWSEYTRIFWNLGKCCVIDPTCILSSSGMCFQKNAPEVNFVARPT